MIAIWMTLAVAAANAAPQPPVDDLSRPAKALISPASWVTADDYPPAAIRSGAQGQVEVMIRVLPSGRIGVCDVARSTGSDLLDAMSCALSKSRARYSPELDSRGRAVESGTKTLRFLWKLPEPDDADHGDRPFGDPFQLQIVVDADPSGRIVDCQVPVRIGPIPTPPGDPCLFIREQAQVPTLLDAKGEAVPSRQIFSMTLTRQPR